MNKFLMSLSVLLTLSGLAQTKSPENKTTLDLKNKNPDAMINSGCSVPSASPSGPMATDPGVIGGPKEERNNPRSLVYPVPGCKLNMPKSSK